MGYVPDSTARGLRSRTTKLFGLAISSITNPIFARMCYSIEERAHSLGYDLLLAHTQNLPEREETCIRRLLSRRVDGLFILPVYRLDPEARIYQELLVRQTPTILLGPPAPFCKSFLSVEIEEMIASYTATQHLLKLGHKRIAYFTGPPVAPWAQERFEGYRRALREAGLDVAPLGDPRIAQPVAALVHLGSVRLQRRVRVHHERQNLVLDHHRLSGVPGLVRRLRRYRGHLFTGVAAVGVEQPAGGPLLAEVPGEVGARRGAREHGPNARHLFGARGVHLGDPRVSVGAAHDGGVKHVRKRHVERVHRRSTHPLVPVHPAQRLPHHPGFHPGRELGRALRLGGGTVFAVYVVPHATPRGMQKGPTAIMRPAP